MSEALIFASPNPQYDNRLLIVHKNCMLRIPAEHVVYANCYYCFVLTFRTILVHKMFCRCCELLKKDTAATWSINKTIPVSISLVHRGCWGWRGWSRKRWRLYFVKNFAQASSLPYLSSTTCGEPVQTSAARFYQIEPLEIEFKPGSNDWTLSHYSIICTVFPHIVSDLE